MNLGDAIRRRRADRNYVEMLLAEILEAEATPGGTIEFVESLAERHNSGEVLSSNQIKALENIQSRMRGLE